MRKDQLYGVGGFDDSHPSGNVLDEFDHGDRCAPGEACTCKVRVRHFDTSGNKLTDRALTKDEHRFFFSDDTPGDQIEAVRAIGDAAVIERISR